MNVVIIEDEAPLARQLSATITDIDPAIKIIAILESVEQSLSWFKANKSPDLIFSDIQLADGVSFDVYKQIDIKCPVVFCTAFDEYLMTAFDTNAISYILKPISKPKVQKALDKFADFQQAFQQPQAKALENVVNQLKQSFKQTILVNHREKIIPIQVKDIAYCCMDTTIIQLCTLQNHKYFLTTSLDDLEKSMDPVNFYRANRQFLINRQAINIVERLFPRKLAVKLTVDTPETITISKIKATEFLQWLEGTL